MIYTNKKSETATANEAANIKLAETAIETAIKQPESAARAMGRELPSTMMALQAKQELFIEMTKHMYFYELVGEHACHSREVMFQLPNFKLDIGRSELVRQKIVKLRSRGRHALKVIKAAVNKYKKLKTDFKIRAVWHKLNKKLQNTNDKNLATKAKEDMMLEFHEALNELLVQVKQVHVMFGNNIEQLFGERIAMVRDLTRRSSDASLDSFDSNESVSELFVRMEGKCHVVIRNGIDYKSPKVCEIKGALIELGASFIKIYSAKSKNANSIPMTRVKEKLAVYLVNCNMPPIVKTSTKLSIRSGIPPSTCNISGLDNKGFSIELCFQSAESAQKWHSALNKNKESSYQYQLNDGSFNMEALDKLKTVYEVYGPACSCGNEKPVWFDANRDEIVCIECAGKRREEPNAKVRSLLMDKYTIQHDDNRLKFK